MYIADQVGASFSDLIENINFGRNYEAYPLNLKTIRKMHELNGGYSIHDAVIVATADILDAKIVTKDQEIIEGGEVDTVWT